MGVMGQFCDGGACQCLHRPTKRMSF
jgi:hypothetical protein